MRQKWPLSWGRKTKALAAPQLPPPSPRHSFPTPPYPEVRQLQGDLDEAVGAGPAFLDEPFAESGEAEAAEVHVIGQRLGLAVRGIDGPDALGRGASLRGCLASMSRGGGCSLPVHEFLHPN